MSSRKFDTKFLKDELGLPCDAIEDTITDTDRWSEHHDIIFEHEGLFYSTGYSCGATEMQHESPWDGEETVDCWQVEKKEVLVEQWVRVKN